MRSVEGQSIQLVIPQYRQRRIVLTHPLTNPQHIADPRTTIDEVTAKQHPPRWMPIDPMLLTIPQQLKQLHQLVRTPMNVTNHVVHQLSFSRNPRYNLTK